MTPAVGSPKLQHPTAFTIRYNGRSLRLTSEVDIFPAFDPATAIAPPQSRRYQALYDTGATHSAVSPQVVTDLQLASIGARNVGVGGGTLATTSHLVNIVLPNRVLFAMVPVAKMVLLGGVDAIIGMDILGSGDFTVTHYAGKTTFSFCCPSRKEIDFTSEIKDDYKVGRNVPCPCGSGKKYKKCHGAAT
jgi:hypothetical protein